MTSWRFPLRDRAVSAIASLAAPLLFLGAILPCTGSAEAAEALNEGAFNKCPQIVSDAERLRCFESLVAQPEPAAPSEPAPLAPSEPAASLAAAEMGKWRLVRTSSPQGEKEAVSVMRSAELSASDPDFAGLVLRCGETDVEVLIALITVFPLRSRPHVTLEVATATKAFDAKVAPPGTFILLPPEATEIMRGPWLSAAEIAATVEGPQHSPIRGLVRLEGLKAALGALTGHCPKPPR